MGKVGRKESGKVKKGPAIGLCACGNKLHTRGKYECTTCQNARLKLEKLTASIGAENLGDDPWQSAKSVSSWIFEEIKKMVDARADDCDIVEWAQRNLTLPPGDGWRGDQKLHYEKYPLQAEGLRIMCDPRVERFFDLQGTQNGKSTNEAVTLSYFMERGTGNIIYVAPTEKLLIKIPQTKFLPIWERSADVGFASSEQGGKRLVWKSGRYIWMALATSTDDMADTSGVTFGFITEHDEIGTNVKHDVVSLTFDRMRFSLTKKLYISGTPRRLDSRGLYALYSNTARMYEPEVPCPHCGFYMMITETDIKYPIDTDPKLIKTHKLAWVVCPECSEKCEDKHHARMVGAARYRCLTPDRPHIWSGTRSPSWFSSKYSFSEAISEFLEASSDPIKLAEWYRSVAAKPINTLAVNTGGMDGAYEQRKSAAWKRELSEIPREVHTITAGVDVGTNGYWLAVIGWGYDGRKYVIWNGLYEPKGPSESDWDNAWARMIDRARMAHGSYLGSGEPPRFRLGLVDSGFNAQHCYKCCKSSAAWLPAKGYAGMGSLYKKAVADPENKHNGAFRTLPLILTHAHMGQELLENSLMTSIDDPNGIAFAWDEGKRIFNHLRGATKKERPDKTYYWSKTSKDADDHLRDALALALMAGRIVKAHEVKQEHGLLSKPKTQPKKLSSLSTLSSNSRV